MSTVTGATKPYRFHIAYPGSRRGLMLLVVIAYFVVAAIGLKAPEYPVTEVLLLSIPAALGILALARAPAVTRSSSWIEVSEDGERIRFVPSFYARKLTAEPIAEAHLHPDSQVVVSRNMSQELFEGFSVAVRSSDGGEQVIWKGGRDFDPLRWVQFSTGFSSATGIPVRLITREVTAEGTCESDWIPERQHPNFRKFAALLTVGACYVGGILVGRFAPRPLIIVVVGLTLWAVQVLVLYACAKPHGERAANRVPADAGGLYILTTLFTFSAQYALAIVVGAYLLRWPF